LCFAVGGTPYGTVATEHSTLTKTVGLDSLSQTRWHLWLGCGEIVKLWLGHM